MCTHSWQVCTSKFCDPAQQTCSRHMRPALPQVPQYILEAAVEGGSGGACSIVCTQPRRIAAMSVAERVAAERGEAGPGQPGCKVGGRGAEEQRVGWLLGLDGQLRRI